MLLKIYIILDELFYNIDHNQMLKLLKILEANTMTFKKNNIILSIKWLSPLYRQSTGVSNVSLDFLDTLKSIVGFYFLLYSKKVLTLMHLFYIISMLICRRVGIGRRGRLKICYPFGCVGSSPTAGTNDKVLSLVIFLLLSGII